MKLKPALTLFLIASLPFARTHSAERQRVFHSEANGYSISIPEGWKKVSNEVVKNSIDGVRRLGAVANPVFELVLATDSTDKLINYPFLGVQPIRYLDSRSEQQLTRKEINQFVEVLIGIDLDTAVPETMNRVLSDETQSMISNTGMSNMSFDEKNMVFSYSTYGEVAIAGKFRILVVGYIGRYGFVQLMFNCLESDWSRYEKERNLMFESFTFDEGMRYQDAPSEWSGILNRIGIRAIQGGLGYVFIAVFLGIVLALFKLISLWLRPAKTESNVQKEKTNSGHFSG